MATPNAKTGASSRGKHEFSSADEVVIRATGRRAKLWGLCSLGLGALMVAFAAYFLTAGARVAVKAGLGSAFLSAATGLALIVGLGGAVFVIVGKLYHEAGASLAEVADTEGDDVAHMMQSLDKLARAFQIESVLSIVAFAVGVALAATGAGAAVGGP